MVRFSSAAAYRSLLNLFTRPEDDPRNTLTGDDTADFELIADDSAKLLEEFEMIPADEPEVGCFAEDSCVWTSSHWWNVLEWASLATLLTFSALCAGPK